MSSEKVLILRSTCQPTSDNGRSHSAEGPEHRPLSCECESGENNHELVPYGYEERRGEQTCDVLCVLLELFETLTRNVVQRLQRGYGSSANFVFEIGLATGGKHKGALEAFWMGRSKADIRVHVDLFWKNERVGVE